MGDTETNPPWTLTVAERRLIARCKSGCGWIVPAQLRMARRLAARGLIEITDETRPNPLRGATERRCRIVEADHGE